MHLEKFDLNLLVAIDALMRTKSVTAAAHELSLTQSAVSSALKRARAHFSDEILYYDGQKMVPTPFGLELEAIVPNMITGLLGVSRMRAQTDLADLHRTFSVIASDYVAIVYLAQLSRQLSKHAPGVSLSVLPFADETMNDFQRGKIDFFIGPRFALQDTFQFDVLFEDSFKCVLWRGNPLAQGRFTADDFFDSPQVLTNFLLADGASHLERFLYAQSRPLKVAATLPSFIALPYYIAGTNNVATIHKRLVPLFEPKSDLVFIDPPFSIPPFRELLVSKEQLHHDTGARLMRAFMLEVGRSLGPSDAE